MNREEALAMIEAQFLGEGLTADERARLFEAVRADPALKAAYDRYATMELGLADGRTDTMRDRILTTVGASEAPARPELAPQGAPAPVVDLAHARATRRRWLALGATAAAAVTLFALVGRGPAEPMPSYAFELSAGAQALRGDETQSERFEPTTRMTIVLRPKEASAAKLEARAALVAPDGATYVSEATWDSAQGAFRLEGRVKDLFDAPPGRYGLVVVVARPSAMPDDLSKAAPGEGREVFRAPVELVP